MTQSASPILGLSRGQLTLIDLETGHVRRRFHSPAECLPPYAFSPDGRLLASASEDPGWKGPGEPPEDGAFTESAYVHELRINIWRVADGKLLRSVPGYSSNEWEESRLRLRFLDRRRLVVPALGGVFDALTGRRLQTFDPPNGHSIAEQPILLLPPLPSAPLRERWVKFPRLR